MSVLHLIKRPLRAAGLARLAERMLPDDCVLLLEDGVYLARRSAPAIAAFETHRVRRSLYVLAQDLALRGMGTEELAPGFAMVDYEGFVDLAVRCEVSVWWSE